MVVSAAHSAGSQREVEKKCALKRRNAQLRARAAIKKKTRMRRILEMTGSDKLQQGPRGREGRPEGGEEDQEKGEALSVAEGGPQVSLGWFRVQGDRR
jgi:hypothetical protein